MQADEPIDQITIFDWETDEVVGTVHMDGTVETDDAAVRSLLGEMAEGKVTTDDSGERTCVRGVGKMTGYVRDADTEYPTIVDAWVIVPPGSPFFLRSIRDSLPSPYRVPPAEHKMLPYGTDHDPESQSELEAALGVSIDEMTEEALAESVFELISSS